MAEGDLRFAISRPGVQDFPSVIGQASPDDAAGRSRNVVGDMNFRDLLNNDQLILVACHDCDGRTPMDPAPLALDLGVATDVAVLKPGLNCPVCGSSDVTLAAFSPLERNKTIELA